MRVCFLLGTFPVYSGVASQAVLQAKELIELGVIVKLGIIARSGEVLPCSDIFDESLLPPSLEHFFIPPICLRLKVLRGYLKFFIRLRKDFDIVHFHGLPSGYGFLIPVFRLLGLKVVIKMTGLGINDPISIRSGGGYAFLNFLSFSCAHSVIATSKALAKAYLDSGLPKARLSNIPNGVDCSRFKPLKSSEDKRALRAKLGLDPNRRIAVFVGSFRIAKGADILFDSFCRIRELFDDVELVVVGPLCPVCPAGRVTENSFMARIKNSFRILLKGNQILVLGKATERFSLVGPKRNVEEWMQAADIFIFPSRREGLPNVVLEAMATALPCITLNIPEITGDLLVDQSLGWCVEDSVESLTKAFSDVLSMPVEASERGENALLRAREHFISSSVAKRLLALYTDLRS